MILCCIVLYEEGICMGMLDRWAWECMIGYPCCVYEV
jgi:hypothetical protein